MPNRCRPVSVDDLYELVDVTDPRCSPDGSKWVALVRGADRDDDRSTTRLWLGEMDGAGRPLTEETTVGCPRWRPDGNALSVVVTRDDAPRLAIVDLEGELTIVGPEGLRVASSAWSPSGEEIAFVGVTPASPRVGPRVVSRLGSRLDGAGWLDDFSSGIYLLAVSTGEVTRLTDGPWHDDHPCWSPDGASLAFISDRASAGPNRSLHRELFTVSVASKEVSSLTRGGWLAALPSYSPDGALVAFEGYPPDSTLFGDNIGLYAVDALGSGEPRALHDELRGPVAGFPGNEGNSYLWEPDGSSIVFLAEDSGRRHLHRLHVDSGRVELLSHGDVRMRSFDGLPEPGSFLVTSAWIDSPTELYRVDPSGTLRPATEFHGSVIDAVEQATWTTWTVAAVDGVESEVFVVEPAEGVTRLGTVVEIHGGPHASHPPVSSYGWLQAQVLAAAGFRVLLPNPRGSCGYGQHFMRLSMSDWGGGDLEDVVAASDRSVTDPAYSDLPLYVGGYSYGGYLSAWAVTQTDRFAAATVGAPMTNLLSWSGTTDLSLMAPAELGGLAADAGDEYVRRSPVTHVSRVSTPVMLYHNEGDRRCPIGQSEELFAALSLQGVEVQLVRYDAGSHDTDRPSLLVDRIGRIVDWYRSHT